MAGIVALMDDVLVGAVGVLSRQPLGVPWRPQALRKPSCQGARGTFLKWGSGRVLSLFLILFVRDNRDASLGGSQGGASLPPSQHSRAGEYISEAAQLVRSRR